MKARRVLLVAYHFPPENSIGGARPFRFYKYLPDHGYRCHAITAADVRECPGLDAEYVADPFVAGAPRGLGFQVERAVRKLLLPGAGGIQWARQAYEAGLRYMQRYEGDSFCVFSTFPPIGVHMAAARLAARLGVPWIADFRDPMAGNPINARLGVHTRAAYAWIENRIVNAADCILANTDSAEAMLKRKYPHLAFKIHLLWNGFDPGERVTPLAVTGGGVRVFTHTGELYAGRTMAPILLALGKSIEGGKIPAAQVRVQLIGPVESRCLPNPDFVRAAEAAGWLRIVPRQIPKAEAQTLARGSDGLLIVQPQSAIQVPGKIFEYVRIGRPVLAFVPRESAIERLLARSGAPFRCVYTDDSPEAMEKAWLEFLTLPEAPVKPSDWFEQSFNAEKQTAYLASLIAKLARA